MKCLYHIQDADRPAYVVSENRQGWQGALDKWKSMVAEENDMEVGDVEDPEGIAKVCDSTELIE